MSCHAARREHRHAARREGRVMSSERRMGRLGTKANRPRRDGRGGGALRPSTSPRSALSGRRRRRPSPSPGRSNRQDRREEPRLTTRPRGSRKHHGPRPDPATGQRRVLARERLEDVRALRQEPVPDPEEAERKEEALSLHVHKAHEDVSDVAVRRTSSSERRPRPRQPDPRREDRVGRRTPVSSSQESCVVVADAGVGEAFEEERGEET